MQKEYEDREIDLGSDEREPPLPLTVTSRVSLFSFLRYMLNLTVPPNLIIRSYIISM